jgi:hypothetical protein
MTIVRLRKSFLTFTLIHVRAIDKVLKLVKIALALTELFLNLSNFYERTTQWELHTFVGPMIADHTSTMV